MLIRFESVRNTYSDKNGNTDEEISLSLEASPEELASFIGLFDIQFGVNVGDE